MSNNPIIPAETLGAWRSWQPGALGSPARLAPEPASGLVAAQLPSASASVGADDASATRDLLDSVIASASASVPLAGMLPANGDAGDKQGAIVAGDLTADAAMGYPTAAELEAIHQEGWQAGHDAGFAEGLAEGHAEGLALGQAEAGAQFEQAWAPLDALLRAFSGRLSEIEAGLSPALLRLAVECGERLAQSHFVCEPQALLVVVREALAKVKGELAQLQVQVHPDDAAILEHFLRDEYPNSHIKWQRDPLVSRGGCIIETGQTRFDMLLETRQAALRTALGLSLAGAVNE
ncbi:FliH/SctL family protein [Craterilacuibacter sp.]|uniref:FliH/SctL family protein n=1 Tax=Craterilacuibacter sp. TaxID=2870909 RepID=UPI003F2A1CB0